LFKPFTKTKVILGQLKYLKMKKMIMVLFLALGLTSFAQERMEGRKDLSNLEMATLGAKRMAMQLDLQQDQEDKVRALYLKRIETRKKMEASSDKASKDERDENRQQREEDMNEMKAELKEILTAAQFQKWKALQEKRRKGRKTGLRNSRN